MNTTTLTAGLRQYRAALVHAQEVLAEKLAAADLLLEAGLENVPMPDATNGNGQAALNLVNSGGADAAAQGAPRSTRPTGGRGKVRKILHGRVTATSKVYAFFQAHPDKAFTIDQVRAGSGLPDYRRPAVLAACGKFERRGILRRVGNGVYRLAQSHGGR